MKNLDLIAYKREAFGKKEAKHLRTAGNVPCVMYGRQLVHHFYMPMILFRDLVYTPNIFLINMDIEGDIHQCVLQDFQVHPVNETIMHADFLEVSEGKEVKMDVPIQYLGSAPGIQKGGKLVQKLRCIRVKALPSKMPDCIDVNIDSLELGESVKIEKLSQQDYTIINHKDIPIASLEIPRALRSAKSKDEEETQADPS